MKHPDLFLIITHVSQFAVKYTSKFWNQSPWNPYNLALKSYFTHM